MLHRLGKQVPNPGGADPDEHLDEVRAAQAEERDLGLAGHGLRQQGLACPGDADQQDPFRDLPAQPLEAFRRLQELDDFDQFGLGLVDAGDVAKVTPVSFWT